MESEEVMAAINSRKKKRPPKKCPAGIYSKTPGRAKNRVRGNSLFPSRDN